MGTISKIINNLKIAANPDNLLGDLAGFVDEKVRNVRSYSKPNIQVQDLQGVPKDIHAVASRGLPKSQSNYVGNIIYGSAGGSWDRSSDGYYSPGDDTIAIGTSFMNPGLMKSIPETVAHELSHARQGSLLADFTTAPIKVAMMLDSTARTLGSGLKYHLTKDKDPAAEFKAYESYKNSLAEIQARDMQGKKVPVDLPEADRTRLYDDMYRKSMVDSVGTYLKTFFNGRQAGSF